MDQSRESLLKNVNYEECGLSDAEEPSGEPLHKFRGGVVHLEDPLADSEYSYSKVKAFKSGIGSGKPRARGHHPLLGWWYGSEYKARSSLARWLVVCLAGTLLVTVILVMYAVHPRPPIIAKSFITEPTSSCESRIRDHARKRALW